MRASEWNTSAEIGGEWRRTLRRTAGGSPVSFAQPTRMELWVRGTDPVHTTAIKTVVATLSGDMTLAELVLSVADVTALGPGRFEHRVLATDAAARTIVLMRGWFVVRGQVGDL